MDGPSTLGGRKTVYLKVRAYTGQDTKVLWTSPGQSTPAYLFSLLDFNSQIGSLKHRAVNDKKILEREYFVYS